MTGSIGPNLLDDEWIHGSDSETVIRMLKEFNDEGLIRMEGKSIEVLDYERIKQISETG